MGKPTKKPSAKIRRYIATHEGKDFRGQNLKFKGDAVGAKYNELIRLYPKIDSLPEGERDALLSTYYNIKPSTFRNKFGRLLQNHINDRTIESFDRLYGAIKQRYNLSKKEHVDGIKKRAYDDVQLAMPHRNSYQKKVESVFNPTKASITTSYDDWATRLQKVRGINTKTDDTYDYRGFYNDPKNNPYGMLYGNTRSHFTDKYKTPKHPTFSNQSIYSNLAYPGGTWGIFDGRDAYYNQMFPQVPVDDLINYMNMAEDNGAIPLQNNGSMYRLDGDLYGGALPNITILPVRFWVKNGYYNQ